MASEIKEHSQPEVKKDENIEPLQDSENANKDKKNNLSDLTREKEISQEKNKYEDKEVKPENQEEKPQDKVDTPISGKDQPKVKKEQPKVKEDPKGKKDESKGKKEQPKDKREQLKDKKEQLKEEQPKEKNEPEGDESEDEEEEVGLLDRPVEVSGCRARKKVERLEVSFSTPKEKQELPEGKGRKLGDCPRIEAQIQKIKVQELKQLHKILFNRVGSGNEVKKNIRKFSGFPFDENSIEFTRKKASVEKLTISVLKQVCSILDIERGGTKDEIVNRIMTFLLNPEDSGKKVPTKKKHSIDKLAKEKKKSSAKKGKSEKRDKNENSDDPVDENMDNDDEDDSGGDESMGGSDEENEVEAVIDEEIQTKSKSSRSKPTAEKRKKTEKPKAIKRKLDSSEDSENEKQTKKSNKMPSDDEISKLVKDILEAADLQEITMKKVIKQVSDAYPDFDLSHKKAFIKSTIKSVIS